MQKIVANVPVFDTGARGATVTFIQRNIGDVLIAWENEALLAAETMAKGQVEIIYPSVTILAEPPVAVVDRNAKRQENGSGRYGVFEVSVYAGRAGNRCETSFSSLRQNGGGKISEQICAGKNVYR